MAEFATVQLRYAEAAAVETAVIAHFAQAVRPTVRPLPDDLVVRLAEWHRQVGREQAWQGPGWSAKRA